MAKLSIITVNLNNKQGLEKTIGSVIGQAFTDFEYIVIDGASVDGSIDIIRKNHKKITRWISEKDTGIYNAMNKGLSLANGEYCLFLNSGDYLYSENTLAEVFKMNPVEDIVYGNMIIENPNGEKRHGEMPHNITLEHMIKDTLWHPVSFIKREVFNKYGFYREDLKVVSDYDFFFKNIIKNKVSTRHIPVTIAVFVLNGISSMASNVELIKSERKKVQMQYVDEKMLNDIQQQINEAEKKNQNLGLTRRIIQWVKRHK
jgi:glycosyltransferase involved in cell wall biosynthesis